MPLALANQLLGIKKSVKDTYERDRARRLAGSGGCFQLHTIIAFTLRDLHTYISLRVARGTETGI